MRLTGHGAEGHWGWAFTEWEVDRGRLRLADRHPEQRQWRRAVHMISDVVLSQ